MTSRIRRSVHRIGVVLAGLAFLLFVTIALYAAARALGWVLAGFMGDVS